MMLWLEQQYLMTISNRLQYFKKIDNNSYNFRCPICGDSQKNKYKTRGYVYEKKGNLFMFCHNCGYSKRFTTFLKEFDQTVYNEYRMEFLKESHTSKSTKISSNNDLVVHDEVIVTNAENKQIVALKSLISITNLDPKHTVKQYIIDRLIPVEQYDELYYCTRFMEWINTIIPDKFSSTQLSRDEPRLVIPFYDADGKLFAVTGRSFKSSSIKYITIKFDDTDKIFGMDRIDPNKKVYIVEGPIDSMFIENSIAFAGSSGNIPKFDNSVVILDNEPRNKEICKLLEKLINNGQGVCIWPDSFKFKDINEAVMGGYSIEDIKSLIDKNTYGGLRAKLRFAEWKIVR